MRTLTRLIPPGARSLHSGLAPSVACGAAAGLIVVAQAALLSQAIDAAFLGGARLASLAPVLLALAAVAVLRAGLLWLQETLAQRFSGELRQAVRDRLVRHLLALGPRFLSGERTGELANTLVGGVEALDAYVAQYLPQAALAAIVPAIVLAAVLWGDPLSALVLLLTFPLVPLFMWLIGSAARERTRRQWVTLSRLSARFLDALAGLATLRAFSRAEDEALALEGANERYRAVTLEVLRLAFVSALVLEALATLGTAVVAVEVGLRLLYARIEFREALFVLVLAPEFYRPLRALGAAFHAGMAGREAASRMAEIADAEGPLAAPAVLGSGGAAARSIATPRPPRIRFESVAFSYDGEGPRALDGFTLDVPAGETVALVGPTGAGKTTAAHLLLRWIEPLGGRILVDDVPLAALTPEEWRLRLAWVPQHPRLFHGTVRENLLLGRRDASDVELARALELAHLDDFVRALPRGLETPVGEGGERLSGGQAQRLALARAYLKDAPVLVLDEPTAQLDLATEAAVVDALGRLCRERTVLLVAHRLTTVAAARPGRPRLRRSGDRGRRPGSARSLGHRVSPAPRRVGRGAVSGPWRRLLAFARPERRRVALAVVLQVLTIASGVGLMATSAWLLSKAALHPSIAALQVAIVGVRGFGVSRAVLRYLERLSSHDVTLRLLARLRMALFRALVPLAPARLLTHGGGDLLGRVIDDVGTLESLYVRVLGPSLSAIGIAMLVGLLLWTFSGALPVAAVLRAGRRWRPRPAALLPARGGAGTPAGGPPRHALGPARGRGARHRRPARFRTGGRPRLRRGGARSRGHGRAGEPQ